MSLFPKYTPAKPAKPAKPNSTLATLATLAAPSVSNITPELNKYSEPFWQRDFCEACGDFNGWRGNCPKSLDDCLLSRVMDCEGDIEKLKGLTIGQGVKTDDVIHLWIESGETIENLFKKPVWLLCIAEYLKKGHQHE